ncbi:MAG: biopolymer transport protein ExbB [Gammaproteobacteria bacterium]|jgi:biopolymer transport protein ExbB
MIRFVKAISAAALVATASLSTPVFAEEAASLEELLKMVKQHALAENSSNKQREREFANHVEQQGIILQGAKGDRLTQENRSEQLETKFEKNELLLADMTGQLNTRLGSLKEMFGVLQQLAGDLQGQFRGNLTSAQFPGRGEFMEEFAKKMGKTTDITTVQEIERVWFSLMEEMYEGGKIASFQTDVVRTSGETERMTVVRVGQFNLIADGLYLDFSADTQKVKELQRQPGSNELNGASNLINASSGEVVAFSLDPAKGQLLKALVEKPNTMERIDQGGVIGYIILSVGFLAMLLAIWRFIYLAMVSAKVKRQLKGSEANENNPLGRVIKVFHDNQNVDNETIELKLGEAILKEIPAINAYVTMLKVIAVVAPLMGLLGTVTGMIETFQAITLFGTGDPKLMAGGISTALMTTVLGLVVAIPVTILHSMISTRAGGVIHILEEQSAGMVAQHREANGGGA